MKRILFVVLAVCVGLCVFGCQKKQQALEEMQQPMSPEDLNRLSSQPGVVTPVPNEALPSGTIISTTNDPAAEQKLEPLPPSGPFKPSDKEVQAALKNAGYYTGSVDGKLGPRSKQAIEEFQKANGLTADGKVGPRTWGALSKYLNSASSADAAGPASGNTAEIPVEAGR